MRFWEGRRDTPQTAECSPARADTAAPAAPAETSSATAMARRLFGDTHPVHETRVSKLKEELVRWEELRASAREARAQAMAKQPAQPQVPMPVQAQASGKSPVAE